MTIETVAIETLSLDPANVRRHSARNQAAIAASLRRFGQQKPIVVDRRNVVRAGNGTLAAAQSLGWKEIRIIRTDLDGSEATAFAIADNRTAELAEWDDAALAEQLAALKEEDFDLADMGFKDKELERLLGQGGDENEAGDEQWLVVVTCRDEADQLALIEQLQSAERECRALMG
jgi:ParB-like chromosome segregation protein Spo0J